MSNTCCVFRATRPYVEHSAGHPLALRTPLPAPRRGAAWAVAGPRARGRVRRGAAEPVAVLDVRGGGEQPEQAAEGLLPRPRRRGGGRPGLPLRAHRRLPRLRCAG